MSLIVFAILAALSLGLTVTLFITRNYMLGFPSGIFWAIMAGYAYQQYTTAWDLWYLIFFAAAGMLVFTIFAAYGLRKHDLSGPDADKGKFIDEEGKSRGGSGVRIQYADDDGETGPEPSWGDIDHLGMHDLSDNASERRPHSALHKRAEKRKAKASWGEFK